MHFPWVYSSSIIKWRKKKMQIAPCRRMYRQAKPQATENKDSRQPCWRSYAIPSRMQRVTDEKHLVSLFAAYQRYVGIQIPSSLINLLDEEMSFLPFLSYPVPSIQITFYPCMCLHPTSDDPIPGYRPGHIPFLWSQTSIVSPYRQTVWRRLRWFAEDMLCVMRKLLDGQWYFNEFHRVASIFSF